MAGWENLSKVQGPARSRDEIISAWKQVYDSYGTCVIYVTGGEPFLYPDFVGIVNGITAYHRVHITSNVSLPLDDFIATVDRCRVELNATYHPQYMELKTFAEQVRRLQDAGFRCGACYLAHPAQLREMLNYRRYLKTRGIDLGITEFCGTHAGREYPGAYSADERAFLSYVTRWNSSADDAQFLCRNTERMAPADATEVPCSAGVLFADINLDGTVRPCSASPACLGNLYQRTLVLLEQPQICTTAHCRNSLAV